MKSGLYRTLWKIILYIRRRQQTLAPKINENTENAIVDRTLCNRMLPTLRQNNFLTVSVLWPRQRDSLRTPEPCLLLQLYTRFSKGLFCFTVYPYLVFSLNVSLSVREFFFTNMKLFIYVHEKTSFVGCSTFMMQRYCTRIRIRYICIRSYRNQKSCVVWNIHSNRPDVWHVIQTMIISPNESRAFCVNIQNRVWCTRHP